MLFPGQIVVGADVMRSAAKEIRRTIGRRILLIAESGLAGVEATESMRNALEEEGVSVVLYTGFGSRSLSGSIDDACRIAQSGFLDGVVGYGSANTLGLARLTSLLIGDAEENDRSRHTDADDILDDQKTSNRGAPFVAAPSAPFDPHVCSPSFAAVDARSRAIRYVSTQYAPQIVVMDSGLLGGTTQTQALMSISGALLISIEGLFSRHRSPVSVALHARAVSSAADLLAQGSTDGIGEKNLVDEARDVSLLASLGASRTGAGIGTAFSAIVHARSLLGMSVASSSVAAVVAKLLCGVFPDTANSVAEFLGAGGRTPDLVESRILELLGGVDLPMRLRDIGFDRRDADGITDNVESVGVLSQYGGAIGVEDLASAVEPIL